MTTPIDHETCSRLLRAYVLGELEGDAPSVAAHLEGCEQCRAEHAGLEILLTPVAPLSEAERSGIHVAVRDVTRPELSHAPAQLQEVRPARRTSTSSGTIGSASSEVRRRQRWMAPALSAAAAVILVVSGIAILGHGISGSGSLGTAMDQGAGGGASRPEANAAGSSAPGPLFAPSPLTGVGQVKHRAGPVLKSLTRVYDRDAARQGLASGFLDRLAQRAPPSVRRQILHCGGRLLAERGSRALLPTYGAIAARGGNRSLVLVFSSSAARQDRLTRFEIDTWPLGSCNVEPVTSSGILPSG
jgi:anti-sigma factor RsiW